MAVDQKSRFVGAPPPPIACTYVKACCVAPLSRAQVCPTKEPCCEGACCNPGDSVTSLCRGMAAQACYKPCLFHAQPHWRWENCVSSKTLPILSRLTVSAYSPGQHCLSCHSYQFKACVSTGRPDARNCDKRGQRGAGSVLRKSSMLGRYACCFGKICRGPTSCRRLGASILRSSPNEESPVQVCFESQDHKVSQRDLTSNLQYILLLIHARISSAHMKGGFMVELIALVSPAYRQPPAGGGKLVGSCHI